MPAKLILPLLLSITTIANASPKPSETDWRQFNILSVEQHVLPAYQTLAITTRALEKQTSKLCQSTDSNQLNQVLASFNRTMDAWQSIQHINFGPVEISLRYHSIQFWPDKKNHTGKQLNALLKSRDESLLAPEQFRKASVSIKGLPAIERMLFSESALSDLQHPYHCRTLHAIVSHIANIADELSSEWQSVMLPQFKDASQLDGYFEDDVDAATALLKTLVEPIEVIRDLKLKRPLGNGPDTAKFKRLESWRSRRSLDNIKRNISALRDFYGDQQDKRKHGLSTLIERHEHQQIKLKFELVEQRLAAIPVPMEQAIITAPGHKAIQQLNDALSDLHKSLESAITKSGIHLGFNSRDGD